MYNFLNQCATAKVAKLSSWLPLCNSQFSVLAHLQQNVPQLDGRIAMVILGVERFKQGTAFSFKGCDFALALRRR